MSQTNARTSQPYSPPGRRRRGPITLLFDLFSSIWTGVTLLVLIFVYCWLGSGGLFYPTGLNIFNGENWGHAFIRQRYEKTEMEWFSWWPFTLMLALLTLALVTVTLRRIRFNLLNAGVWTVHLGLIVLMIGCVIYFGLKVEGDTVVYRRAAVISAPGAVEPARLVLRPGARTSLACDDGTYDIAVLSTTPGYELLTGDDAGKTTYMAQLSINGPEGGFIRQLLVGYPQYTEDVIPGQGRAIKVIGRRVLDERLSTDLHYSPEEYFYLQHSSAIYARLAGQEEWSVYALKGLPRFREHVSFGEDVQFPKGSPAPRVTNMQIPGKPGSPDRAIDGVRLEATAYLPYARLEAQWAEGGASLNPVVRVELRQVAQVSSYELVAFDPRHSRTPRGEAPLRFRWVRTPQELEELNRDSALRIRVPSKEIDLTLPLAELSVSGGYAVPRTDYTLSFERLIADWMIAGGDAKGTIASVGLIGVKTPTRSFSRAVVHPDVSLSQDIDSGGTRHADLLETDLELSLLNPGGEELVVIAGPDDVGLHVMLSSETGAKELRPAAVGQEIEFMEGHLGITVDQQLNFARTVTKPCVVPVRERNPKAESGFSMVKIDVVDGDETQSTWLPFSQYPSEPRFGMFAKKVRLKNGRELELLYSRDRRRLPVPVALDEFELETYPGQSKPRDYISRVRFLEDGQWSDPVQVHSNNPTSHRRLWFFQATWDPPEPERGYGGMNYTGLGVGNREGIPVMLAGTILTIAGMIWAFYVKPTIKRRRRLAVLAELGRCRPDDPRAPVDAAATKPIQVSQPVET